MTTQHTPGPWEFIDNALVGQKIDDKPVWLRPVILRSITGVSESNAHLIAAAPELLAALKSTLDLVEIHHHEPEVSEALTIIRAAIAKAEGGAV